jgi:RNA polymerase sigma-70 factor (ECF subfamily)
MGEENLLAEQFEANRAHLRGVAFRMLGSLSEAEDAVQEVWLRLSRSDTGDVANLTGWLTTVVARVCLDMLRARKSRREVSMDANDLERVQGGHLDSAHTDSADINSAHIASAEPSSAAEAEQEMQLADSIGLALLVVLQTLAPAERIAFVLHDLFDLPFDEIGPILGRSPVATRQLASRARRRVQGKPSVPEADLADQRKVVDAFLTASRSGDLNALLAMLDPDVVVRADRIPAQPGVPSEVRGAANVARFFSGRAQAARPALVDHALGVVVAPQGRLLLALNFTIANGKILAINAITDPARLQKIDLAVLND